MRPGPRAARWQRAACAAALALGCPAAARPQEPGPPAGSGGTEAVRPAPAVSWSGEGEAYAFLGTRIDYVGVFRHRVALPSGWRFVLQNTVPVRSASGRGVVIVEDVDYRAEGGLALRAAGVEWIPFLSARGSEGVDREGSRGILAAGLRVARSDPAAALDWQVEAAAVLSDFGLEARWTAGAGGEWRALRRARWEIGFQAAWDALWIEPEGALRNDLTAGGFARWLRPGGVGVSLHALYYRGRHPLGLEETGVLAGARFSGADGPGGAAAEPRLEGALAAGGGDDRVRARQLLVFSSSAFPAAGRLWRFRLLADNVLLDASLKEIYYILEGGVETAEGAVRAGLHFHHRSGHLLGQPNDRRLSLNVVEVAARSEGWVADLPRWEDGRGLKRLSFEVRAGAVLSSEFGERQRWSARAGAMWTPPGAYQRLAPFLGLRGQIGEARGWTASAGVHTRSGTSLAVVVERESQRLDRRDTSWSLVLGRRY